MRNCIYREMIEDSPLAFIHLNFIKDDKSEYIGVEIKNFNKAYECFFGISDIDTNKTYILDDDIKLKTKVLLKKAIESKKYTTEIYEKKVGSYFYVEIYHSENEEFCMRFNKISKQYMKLSSILKNSPFMAWIKDINGFYVDVNENFMKFFDKTYEEIIGKTDFDIFPQNIAKEVNKNDEKVLKSNKLHIYEEFIEVDKNNQVYLQTAKWTHNEEGNDVNLGTIGISIEITNKIELLKNIEKNEKIFLEIANNIEEVIIIKDEKKAQYISPSFEKIFETKPDDLYEDINNWNDKSVQIEYEGDIKDYNFKDTYSFNFKLIKSGSEDRWFWCRVVSLLDGNSNILKKVIVISDITQNKKLEMEIEKLRMDFFANLSHELRTPINLIISSLQVLNLKIDNLDKVNMDYFNTYLNIISQNGKRLLKLVNNLIDTTKLDAGHFDYLPTNNNIINFIEEICDSVSHFIENNKMSIIFDTNAEEKIIGFDQDNIERVMLNLISNAIKFNKPGGQIEVNINCTDKVKISVKDKGIGIPENKLESIFGRFEQVKNKFKNEREGSGIGLNLVKSIIEMHNGSIEVKSKLGEGSEFIITLPDILVSNQNQHAIVGEKYLNNSNRMNIEFSDIYV
ncbi:MAG: PAS domain-containing sensor histidine kinase [Paraclostridium sp.]|uniref:sensor histidine kinase n=1 Tax=Paraclostridium sp. TaxID=2023273 RepID=UPI003F2DB7EF